MLGSYVAFNLLPSDPFDLLASCIVSLIKRINKYICMYVCNASLSILENVFPRMASGLVTPVIHPNNFETAVKITLNCTYDGLGFLGNGRDNVEDDFRTKFEQ